MKLKRRKSLSAVGNSKKDGPKKKKKVSKVSTGQMGLFCNVVLHLYCLVMLAMFAFHSLSSFKDFFAKKIVENVNEEPRMNATLPSVTICPFPGFKTNLTVALPYNLSNYCPEEAIVAPQCIEEILYDADEIIQPNAVQYPFGHPIDTKLYASKGSLNLFLGSCVTYEKDEEPVRLSALIMDLLTLPQTPYAATYALSIHDRGRFLPLLGVGSEFTGQLWLTLTTTPYTITTLEVTVTEVHHQDRDEFPCNQDSENYNIVQCYEDYVEAKIGCKSPWDKFPATNSSKLCQTHAELDALREIHVKLYVENAAVFRNITGCLRPCKHQTFTHNIRTMNSPTFLQSLGTGESLTAVGIGLMSTNKKTVKEEYLYGLSNLVGEVGGSMGLFLGISFVSMYQMLIQFLRKTWTKLF